MSSKTPQETFFALTGTAVTDETLPAFLNRLGASISSGADVNAPHPAPQDSRGADQGDTALDHYKKRKALHERLAMQERDGEEEGTGEALYSAKAELCEKIIGFLREHGAKTSEELGRGGARMASAGSVVPTGLSR